MTNGSPFLSFPLHCLKAPLFLKDVLWGHIKTLKAEQVAFTANLGRIKTIKAKNTALTAKLGHIKTCIDKRRVKNAQRAHLRLLVAEFAIVSKIDKNTLLNLYMAAVKTYNSKKCSST